MAYVIKLPVITEKRPEMPWGHHHTFLFEIDHDRDACHPSNRYLKKSMIRQVPPSYLVEWMPIEGLTKGSSRHIY